jgi:ubiquitin carboxyl-terminal hydrolase 34
MHEVLETLSLVLRGTPPSGLFSILSLANCVAERPKCDEELEYFDNGSDFSSRLIELLFQAKSLPVGSGLLRPQTPLRSGLAAAAYRTLISAYEVSDAVWTAFTTDATVVTLHAQLILDKDIDFSARVSHPIANLFDGQTSSRELQDFYWRVLYPCIPQAMSATYMSESYFAIANKVLDSFDPTQREESWARELVEGLNSQLWSYQHSESPPLFTSDRAMTGLLRLFSRAVGILKKKNKGPLDGLPLQLFRHLLFPPSTDTQHRPLVQEEIRGIVYDLIRTSFVLEADYNELVNLALEAAQGSVRDPGAGFPGMSEWMRPACNASGLTNLGMTCYMNSLLQQLFANLQFRKFILDQEVMDFNRQDILFRVQQLFANMQDSVKPYAETGDLAAALNVQVGIQEDVHTFYTTLLSRLEDAMPDKESRRALTSFFTGKSVTQIKGDCGHVSSREEPFTELSITVKNKASLHDSLNEFVQGEPLEGSNKYMCMSCESENDGRLVNALRRTCLDEVPNSLTVCLKRFAFENILDGENKVNDRFEFPAEIDMSLYNRSHLENPDANREPDVFELVGVIVHQGSLSYGHYWSYVRVSGPPNLYRCPWMYLEDGRSFQCGGGIQEVQEQCFGGLRWSDGTERPDSAYVLFYQRKSYVSEADGLNAVARHLQIDQQILPTVPVQNLVEEGVDKDNTWRVRIALLFSNQFSEFLKWLLEQYPLKLKSRRDAIESLEDSDVTQADHESTNDELDARIGELIVTYVLRIFLPDPKSEKKLPDLMSSLNIVMDSNPAIAAHIGRHFARDQFGCDTISRHRSWKVRSDLFGFIETCLASVRHVSSECYDELASMVIKAHSYLLHNAVGIANGSTLDTFPHCWREYFAFAANFAKIGSKETSLVLEQGYLGWIYEMILFPWDPKTKKRHMALTNNLKSGTVDRSPLYDFLHDLFDGHVDLSDYSAQYLIPGDRELTSRGWRLREEEIDPLLMQNPKLDRPSTSLLFDTGVHHCSLKGIRWKDYAPGKLVGLLVGYSNNEVLSERIWDYMKIQYDREEKELDPLLYMTLHICLRLQNVAGGTQRCKDLLEQLSRNLLLWESRERKSLWFFREAYLLAPEAVVQSLPIWAPKFLTVENVQSRQATSDCLKDIIFGPAPMQDDLLEATRIRSTRRFVSKCQQDLDNARQRSERRGRHECMITAMKHASDYLIALQEEIQHQQEHGISISNRVMVEYDEVKPYVSMLVDYLEGLGDWEPETILPTRTLGIRRSVEVDDSDELDESDADVEDVMSEVSGY